jgi:hypothetical protein
MLWVNPLVNTIQPNHQGYHVWQDARRIKTRLGAPTAINAGAHKLAQLFYRLLKYGEAYVGQTYRLRENANYWDFEDWPVPKSINLAHV